MVKYKLFMALSALALRIARLSYALGDSLGLTHQSLDTSAALSREQRNREALYRAADEASASKKRLDAARTRFAAESAAIAAAHPTFVR